MIKPIKNPDQTFLSVKQAAKEAPTDRRTIQRWLKGPNPKIQKTADGLVCLGDVMRQRQKRTVGRPPQKPYSRMRQIKPNWERIYVPVAHAAERASVNRRTIQRWLKGPNPKIQKDANGLVCLADVIRQREQRTVGRPATKEPNGEEGPYWEIAGTPSWKRASEYFGKNGSKHLRGMLACLAHDQIIKNKLHMLKGDLEKALNLVARLEQKKRDGEEWYALARRELRTLR
ncbi:MAG: hypothetical protein R3F13_05665 [Prosthecobacter sp.]